ncbi:MAG: chromosomal replication initiator protein DnaA [Bacteroidales bacterium]|nr:chromosomal replication initiator protein DnaA [Bacteroidales bacterium]MBQ7214303.1 chromosomal replication initiator protein DnaA [Bacteroidales bacterium]MBR3288075.1 chromosomal replication initiator protein DnaA [Bacteroidales bacterium]MCR5714888.1 chromosomal replication initiator protein DnaA [Bacteroidales bacterium]
MHHKVWENCLRVFKDNLDKSVYTYFFGRIKPISVKGHVLTIEVPSQFYYDYLEAHYSELLKMALQRELGAEACLEYRIPINPDNQRTKNHAITLPPTGQEAYTNRSIDVFPQDNAPQDYSPFGVPGTLRRLNIDPQLNPAYSFSNFIEGDCNRLGRAAGLSIAEKPGNNTFNPLFIHSKPGLGKTHLAQAIGIQIKEWHPEKTVLYVNASTFQDQFQTAKIKNELIQFIHFYQLIDVLIIDDMEHLANKVKTQKMFFDIFNYLQQSNKQIIMTSDKAPAELEGMEDRLLSRFRWGLNVELDTPDYETRLKVLRQKAYKEGIALSDEVFDYVASNVTGNFRELEGAIISLIANATLVKQDITPEFTKSVLERLNRNRKQEISIDYIKRVVCSYYNLSEEQLLAKTRKREIVQARYLSMYFAKMFTKCSLTGIGTQIGKKDHATVLYACKTVNNLMATDKQFRMQAEEIEKKIKH